MKNLCILSLIVLLTTPFLQGEGNKKVEVTAKVAEVRAEPGLYGNILKMVKQGEVFEILEIRDHWYKIKLPVGLSDSTTSGYIHRAVVKLSSGEAESPPQEKSPPSDPAPLPKPKKVRPMITGPSLFSGSMIKFGFQFSPQTSSFSDRWLAVWGSDFGIHRNFTIGYEIQPYYRHTSFDDDNAQSILGSNLFVNVKGGVNLGDRWDSLTGLKVFGGIGAGATLDFNFVKTAGESSSQLDVYFAWHLLGGVEIDFSSLSVIFEYQIIKNSHPRITPDPWRHFLMFGVRF